MPYSKPSEVPDNVAAKYKPQFMEVWNSVYAASIKDKKSPAQAEEDAFKQAHGVINAAKKKDERDVSSDGPGFGPVEKKGDGGQAADPTASLRFSEDQPRDPNGKFASGSQSDPHEHEAVAQAGALKITGSGAVNVFDPKFSSTIQEGKYVTHIDAQGNKTSNHEAVAAHDAALAAHQASINTRADAWGKDEKSAAAAAMSNTRGPLEAAHAALLASQGVKTDEQGRVPVQIGRTTYYAKYNADKSAEPNAMPSYHAETKSGSYLMEMKQSEVDRGNAKYTDKQSKKDFFASTGKGNADFKNRSLSHLSDTRETYMSIERRYIQELRVGMSQGDEMALVGYAARFNQPSKDLGGFRETIAPGAFKRALAEKSDVRALFNHSADKVLGRTASGTLTVVEDESGLKFRCQLDPNQQMHRDLYSAVKRGDINECSFAFTPNGAQGDDWQNIQDERGNWFISRTLKDVNLFDVSVVTHPAYDGTGVSARDANITPEIRSILTSLTKSRVNPEKRDEGDSLEEYINEVSKALAAAYPHPSEGCTCGCCQPMGGSYGKYWICETYDTYVIVTECGTGEYCKISYVENPDGDSYVFGQPQPVEKEWVPSERSKSVTGEMRAFTAEHMKSIADAHTAEAAARKDAADAHAAASADHSAAADAHTAMAAAAQKEADRMEKCSATRGDCGVKGCSCQNQMMSERDMEADDFDYEDLTPEEIKALLDENRSADAQVVTKKVDGKNMRACAFRTVGDPKDTSTWSGMRAKRTKEVAPMADERTFQEDMEIRFRVAMASTEIV